MVAGSASVVADSTTVVAGSGEVVVVRGGGAAAPTLAKVRLLDPATIDAHMADRDPPVADQATPAAH
jgi:hypothetical protein